MLKFAKYFVITSLLCLLPGLAAWPTPPQPLALPAAKPLAVAAEGAAGAAGSDADLVNLKEFIPSLLVEIVYATPQNFTGVTLYDDATPYLRRGTAQKLKKAAAAAAEKGCLLKVWDAYRSPAAQFRMWEVYPDANFVANPHQGFSDHSRGVAVDVTLADSQGRDLPMPSRFDEFGRTADRDYRDVSPERAANARLLEAIMDQAGFIGLPSEWWHYIDTERSRYGVAERPASQAVTRVVISAVGDCTIGDDPDFHYIDSFDHEFERRQSYGYFFENVRPYLAADDLTIANLESTLTTHEVKNNKLHQGSDAYFFRGYPAYVHILTEGGVETVNLANNHSLDYLQEGFDDTVAYLQWAGVVPFGYHLRPVVTVKGIRFGLVGYNVLGPLEEGVDIADLKREIAFDLARLKQDLGCQVVIASFHWGNEYSYRPSAEQKSLARFAVDQGADLVLGHHPHVLQPIETYRGKQIVYSLANFSFGGNQDPYDQDTMIFQQEFVFDENNQVMTTSPFRVIPCTVSSVSHRNNYQPTPATGATAARILRKLGLSQSALDFQR